MNNEVLTLGNQDIRGTDSNSLLRLYDLANEIFQRTPLQQERARAERALQRIAKELENRHVPLRTRQG
jgi:hypothetical protein